MSLLYEKEDRIVTITLNRTEALNAFDMKPHTWLGRNSTTPSNATLC